MKAFDEQNNLYSQSYNITQVKTIFIKYDNNNSDCLLRTFVDKPLLHIAKISQ